jgi:uncharacterized membrane protein
MRRVSHVLAASFNIHFKTAEFYPLIRRVHLTEIDIFSYVGGLLGLFFGISVLSIAELVHYFILICRRLKIAPLPVIKVTDTEARSVWKSTKHYCLHYLQNSSIHSFLFIGDSDKKTIERLVWVLTFALSITGCVFMIQKLRQKSNINSITTVIVDGGYDITKIPFPAVTIFSSYPSIPTFGDFFTFHKDTKPSDPAHENTMYNDKYFRDYEDVSPEVVHEFPYLLK